MELSKRGINAAPIKFNNVHLIQWAFKILRIKGNITMLYNTTEKVWDYLVEQGIATDEELKLVTLINGYSIESLEGVVYARTGFNNMTQLIEEEA